ncbi:MAG: SDR family oxidoreductase [Acidobacteriota bacterium]|nr:SDR family oxidoreductase [Blastocatellia bacterium]MDW8411127.1 SDR family oxidoreductase [Acidobacteriota bacterium]
MKVAIVTGASAGIGLAITERLLAEGYAVLAAARNSDGRLDKVVAELQSRYGEQAVAAAVCDVRNFSSVRSMFERCDEYFGGLDVLINNAGIGHFKSIEQTAPEEWHAVIETNLNGVYYCSHLAIPRMRSRSGGYIINIGSLAGKEAFANAAAYCASKFALVGFSEALMQEVRYDNIRVSYIMPGSVRTSFTGRVVEAGVDEWKIAPEDIAQAVVNLLELDPRSLISRVEIRPSKPPKKA